METGTQHFSELKRKIGGVSERMRAQTLQWLAGAGSPLPVNKTDTRLAGISNATPS
ncbi:hypothetical protein [Mesorhizobium sp. M1393]|uniref:hypothetical protein n=1 Tax=Mesorhizobium sp. M1393 TaxID=2957094 RepID=UPI003339D018